MKKILVLLFVAFLSLSSYATINISEEKAIINKNISDEDGTCILEIGFYDDDGNITHTWVIQVEATEEHCAIIIDNLADSFDLPR